MMNVKRIYGGVLSFLCKWFGVDFAKKFDAKLRFGRTLDLKNPKTLADKVSYIELHKQSPLAAECTDKYEVRAYVEKKGLSDILVPIVGGPWEHVVDVKLDEMPERYVLKATHGCKMNYIVEDKNSLDKDACRKEMQRWLDTTYGVYSMEPHYTNIPHRIYVEEFLDFQKDLIDYKIHCLNGVPTFFLVTSERQSNGDKAMCAKLDIYDMEWMPVQALKLSGKEIPGDGKIPRPRCLEQMVEVAKKLSEDFKFVRVDLYELNGKVYFGELTFSPAACVFGNFTDEFNEEMGKLLQI